MASGCITFLIYKKFNKAVNFKFKISSNISLLVILANLFLPAKYSYFSTLLCVLMTCSILFDIDNDLNKNQLLNNRILVLIGKMSYSLYLWHWGIISLSRWTIGISLQTLPIQILLIFLLSSISYIFIENPFRASKISY